MIALRSVASLVLVLWACTESAAPPDEAVEPRTVTEPPRACEEAILPNTTSEPARRVWRYNAVEVLTAEGYWFYEILGMLANVEREGSLLRGDVLDIHGPRPFEANTDDWTDPWGKTRGAVSALRRLIVTLDLYRGPDEEVRQLQDQISQLTGETLDTAHRWKLWLEENQEYLYWSDDAGGLRIDKEAKRAGVSVDEYRASPEERRSRK